MTSFGLWRTRRVWLWGRAPPVSSVPCGLISEGVDVNYEGASGPVDLDGNGDVRAGSIEVWRIEDGEIVTVRQVPVELSGIVDELRENAEEFEYTIGKRGGTLTSATISEPLTLNLAIANDASSSDVLGYLFEGLTETSWLTDRGRALRWRSLGSVRMMA